MTDVANRLAGLSEEKRKLIEMRLRMARQAAAATPELHPRPRPDGTAPLSFAQQRMWLLDQMEPGAATWNIPFPVRLRGTLDVPALERALNGLRERHESLRTTFAERDGVAVQVIHPFARVALPVDDLSGLDAGAREAELARRAHADANTGFDLVAGPLFRARLLRLAADEHALLICLHHVVTDGWSMGVISRELNALYAAFTTGAPNPLPAPALQYADFAAWQRETLAGERLDAAMDFWRRTLAGAPPALELPTDHPRPRAQQHRGGSAAYVLDADTVSGLRHLAQAENATLFAAMLAGVRAVLARWSGEGDVVIGTPVAGRTRVELEPLVGFFVNTLALRAPVSGDPAFRERVRRERDVVLDAFAHQELPFERIVDELKVPRDPARSPLFQVIFSLTAGDADRVHLPGVELEPLDAGYAGSKYDLAFGAHEMDDGAALLVCDYDVALFAPETGERILRHLLATLQRAALDPDAPLSVLTVADDADATQADAWSTAAADAACGGTFPARFAEAARRAPDAPAIVSRGGEIISYGELDARTAALAAELRAIGVGPEAVVGVFVEWSPELPVAMLGAMRAGGAYLPLDPSLPAERIALLIEDSGAGAIVTTPALRERLPLTDVPVAVVDVRQPVPSILPELPEIDPGTAAYLFYTSGSTGTPKGVLVPHGAALAHFAAAAELYGMTADDRMLGFAAQGFDPSLEQLITPLITGASLAVRDAEMWAPAEFAERVRELEVTVANPPTVYFHQLMRDPKAAGALKRGLRLVLVGGEALHPHAARAWDALPGAAELINVYGPTETVVTSTAYRLPSGYAASNEARISVGTPIAGRQPRVLDDALRPVPAGAPGELYLGGIVQSRGYHRRPALTAAAFIPDPFSPRPGARMYRTGDRARWRADGTLEFLGRADEQVKVRGARVEPGEVEAALRALPAVAEGAVVVRPDAHGEAHLVAFVVPRGNLDASAIRAELAASLPSHLVPTLVVGMDALPRTPNGKLDRRALPTPDFSSSTSARHQAPSTPDEEMLAALWAEVLKTEAVGAGDDFFERGGHSLLATQLVSRIRSAFGVEMPLRAVFEAPVLAAQARRIAALRAEGGGAPAGEIPRADRTRPLPLSFAQERLWFIDQLEAGSAAYNVPLALDLAGELDAAALERSLGEIIRRHESLRTVFSVRNDEPVQMIRPFGGFHLPIADLTSFPADERQAEAERRIGEEARTPFDLTTGPVLRATLLRVDENAHTLVLVFHHIATDAWSSGIFFSELAELYTVFARGGEPALDELPVQYADFAAWQRGWLRGEVLERQMDYWRRRLAGVPAVLELPADRPRPAVQDVSGELLPFHLAPETASAARALAKREGATLFMVLLAAFQAVLHRWSGEEDIVVGTPIANRTRPELERLIGFFDNTLALRTDLSGDPAFAALLRRVRETTLEAYAHQDLPFEKLVDELKTERSLSHTPVFQVMFTLQNTPTGGGVELGGVEIRGRAAETGTSRFDLTLILTETEDGALAGWAEYATALFDAATIERMTAHLDALLRQAAERPEAPLSALSLLSHAEEETVLRAFNATDRPETDLPIHAMVARQAALTPDAVALEYDGEGLTYAELEARANRLAHRLIALGVRPDARVAVSMERSIDMPVAVLAVLKAGGCYVAVDPNYPADRVAYMLEDSRAAVVLTTSSVAARLPETDAAVLRVDAERVKIDAESSDDPRVEVHPENLAYVLYTSGSTGKPKGAALAHRPLVNLIEWQIERWGDAPAARALQFASLSFDVSFHEIFSTWATGGTLVLVDDDTRRDGEALLAYLRDERIERLFLPFAALQNLAEQAEQGGGARVPTLREVRTAGEALRSTPQLRAFFAANPGLALDNDYGPSETHVITSYRLEEDPADWAALPPIGAPIGNSRMYVLDARMRPVPVGVPGELYSGGANLARGYLGRPGLTAQKFVPDPFGPPGARLYRTGDRVRWRVDGNLDYVGRTDFQVKIRGFRVEPGEVEAALTEHPSVVQAAVVVRGEGAAKRLAAYVVPAAGARPSVAELRAHLSTRLPEYMVPTAWTTLQALPLTPSGKVDRRSLPEPATPLAGEGHVAPRNAAERMVADAWAAVLGVHPGAHDNFFDLGGHSLRATQVMSRIRRAFGIELPLRALFEAPTVAGLAERAAAAQPVAPEDAAPLVPVERGRTAPLSFTQQRFWFVERMGAAGAAYNMPLTLRLRGELDVPALEAATNLLRARHETLRTVFRFADGQPVQEVRPATPVPLPLVDLRDRPEAERAPEAERIVREDAERPFDLAGELPLRLILIRLADDDHLLLINLHHIAADGWSIGIVYRELGVLYQAAHEGRPDPLPPLPIQYADYALWQRERLAGAALEQMVEWWRLRLEGAPTLALPTDHPHPPLQTFRGATLPFGLSPEVSEQVERLAREEDATAFMVLLAAFSTLLARWSGQDDVVVGSPVAGRYPEETEGLIGVFVNTLALRTDLSGNPSFREAVRRVRDATVDAYAHQEVPFERLVEALKVERNLSAHPVFQVMFSMHPGGGGSSEFGGLQAETGEGDNGTSKVDLILTLAPTPIGLRGAWQYATDLWEPETIDRLSRHLAGLLDAAVARPDVSVHALPLMDADERAAVAAWSRGIPATAGPGLVHELVRSAAARMPERPALVDGERVVTYAEFDRTANRLARKLARMGVRPESRVAICFDRTTQLVQAQYGAMKAGAAYVPIDPAYPPDRIAHLLRDSAAPVLVTSAELAARLDVVPGAVLCLDGAWDDGPADDDAPLDLPLDPANAVYVIYTSGSTGTPKGVALPHSALANLVRWRNREFGVTADDRTPLVTGVGFDASALEIWPALAAGASLHVIPAEERADPARLRDFIVREGMTIGFIATPIAEALLPLEWPAATRMRAIITGGDAARLRPRPGTPFRYVNGYGPTENAVISTAGDITPDGEGQPDIGRAIDGTQAYVLDERLEMLPVGVTGELFVGGAGVARGYLNRAALTAARFVPDPFGGVPGARLYHTGDRVRWRADGRIDFLGRADNQVKVRGHRIEPGEIETVLMRHPGVRQAVVAVRGEGEMRRLVAWVSAANGGQVPVAELRGWLRSRLPEYMVPAAWVAVESFPLTPNGKVDRGRLPDPEPE
ncbi:MAG TPA: amino acid adenylation domain-containing protein, partial [Longimicrobium sp.]|nr:amino acid adenylation domain-containing protein [Longimicrobium sp.]